MAHMLDLIEQQRMRKSKSLVTYFHFSKELLSQHPGGMVEAIFHYLSVAISEKYTVQEIKDLFEVRVFNSGTEFDLPMLYVNEGDARFVLGNNLVLVIATCDIITPITDTPEKYKLK